MHLNKLTILLFLCSLTFSSAATEIIQKLSANRNEKFEENIGQFNGVDSKRIKFRLRQGTDAIFLLNDAIVYQFCRIENLPTTDHAYDLDATALKDVRYSSYRMDLELIGANPDPRITKSGKSVDYFQYAGLDMKAAYSYSKITYHEVYENIDWVFFITDKGVKYEFVVRPGGDPSDIQFQSRWVENSSIDESGNLVLENRLGKVQENKPVSFQNETKINTHFILEDNTVQFGLDTYDSNETLIIDPQIVWGTYYGGDGTEALYSVATDSQGNVFAAGTTYGSNTLANGGFLNTNPAQFGGAGAPFLVKFDPDGTRLWATYYGGTGSFSGGFSCETDSHDNIYLAGFTLDTNGIAFNGHQNFKGGSSDAFLVKFNSAGQRLWGTYFGGIGDESGLGLAIDGADNIHLTGRTFSNSMIAFNGFQNTPGQDVALFGDAFLSKFDSSGVLLWSTYFGGERGERGFAVSCSSNGDCCIAGTTRSLAGVASVGGHQTAFGSTNSDEDAFLAKFNAAGTLIWSTYYGGANEDKAYDCAIDNAGNVYMSGQTASTNNIFFNGFQDVGSFSPGASFLVKFDASGTRLWGTYYGSAANEIGYTCATDAGNNVFLAGRTQSATGISFQGFQNAFGSSSGNFSDGFIVKFDPAGSRLWASYYGGSNNDFVRGMHIDAADQIYLTGTTQSANNIFFQGFQSTQQNETGFITKIGCPTPQILNLPVELCANSSLQLAPYPQNGTFQLIGPGTLSGNTYTAPNANTSTNVTLQYTVNGSSSCPSSTESFDFTVLPNVIADASITASSLVVCENDNVVFNVSIQNAGANPNITWLLNNQVVLTNQSSYTNIAPANNDLIQCIVESNNPCAAPSIISTNTLSITVNPIPNVTLIYSDLNGGTLITSTGLGSYEWFLNGTLIAGANSSFYVPTANGIYTVVATDVNGCTNSDQFNFQSLAIGENEEQIVKIHPVPAYDQLAVSFVDAANREIAIYDAIGQLISKFESIEQELTIDVHSLSAGTYTLLIQDTSKVFRSTFVVSR